MRLCCPRQPFQIERPCQEWRTRSRAPCRRAPAGAGFPALGRRHSCLRLRRRPAPVLSHRALRADRHAPARGPSFARWPRHRQRPGRPARLHSLADARATMRTGRRHLQCFAVHPERPNGVRGQNRNLSLISVAERNQHRHSMTPGRLAAVKDRGYPPILACCGYRLASKNRLPPRPLLAAAARARRRP